MGRLNGSVALVTGGARGIGAASARLLAADGAAVAVADIDLETAEALASTIRDSGGQSVAVHLDVRDEQQWQHAVSHVASELGPVTVLLNNAGIGSSRHADGSTMRLHELPRSEWNRVIDINVRGVQLGIQNVVPGMRRAKVGSIINISSIGAIVGSRVSAYGSSKGAVRSLSKAAAVNLAPHGIRVNSIHPGVVVTDMTRVMRGTPESLQATIARYPMARLAEPEEIAEGVVFLASDRSAFMTGSEVVIDGGLTAW